MFTEHERKKGTLILLYCFAEPCGEPIVGPEPELVRRQRDVVGPPARGPAPHPHQRRPPRPRHRGQARHEAEPAQAAAQVKTEIFSYNSSRPFG